MSQNHAQKFSLNSTFIGSVYVVKLYVEILEYHEIMYAHSVCDVIFTLTIYVMRTLFCYSYIFEINRSIKQSFSCL